MLMLTPIPNHTQATQDALRSFLDRSRPILKGHYMGSYAPANTKNKKLINYEH